MSGKTSENCDYESGHEGCTNCGAQRGFQGDLTARLKYYEGAWWCEECLKNRDGKGTN
jgi:hypothetical protein